MSEPLRAAVDAHPRTLLAARLLSRAWSDAVDVPASDDLNRLVFAATCYPQDVALVASVTRLLLKAGDANRARQVLRLSLAHVAHPPQRAELERLLREVQAAGLRSSRADESTAVP